MEELNEIRKESKYYDYVKKKKEYTTSQFNQTFRPPTAENLNIKLNILDKIIKQPPRYILPVFMTVGVMIAFYLYRRTKKQI